MDLATLWHRLCKGELFITQTWCRGGRCYATVRVPIGGTRSNAMHLSTLERVLVGESQKSLAIDLNVSVTTIATWAMLAMSSLMTRQLVSRAPILLVAAALAARGVSAEGARLEQEIEEGAWTISITVPGETLRSRLSPAEGEVTLLSIQGESHQDIAAARGTSLRTVANQLASVFTKIGVHGRSELRAHAVREYAESCRPHSHLASARSTEMPLSRAAAGAAA